MSGSEKKFYETDEFKTLEKEWMMKLAKDGFTDIESKDQCGTIQPQIFYTQRKQKSAEYWLMIEAILNTHKFERDTDRVIVEKHLLGHSLRSISALLKNEPALLNLSFKSVDRSLKRTIASFVSNL